MATMEEKAKRYDEALKVAKDIRNGKATYIPDGTPVIEALFPELAESEDEKIRKSLIILLQHFCKGYRVSGLDFPVSYKDMLAWLEKRSENDSNKTPIVWKHWKDGICGNREGKPIYLIKNGDTYSISPVLGFECDYIELSDLDKLISSKDTLKFNVGDWVATNFNNHYSTQITSVEDTGYETNNPKGFIRFEDKKDFHIWTIQDAKDGDILATDISVFVYAKVLYNKPYAYCGVDKYGVFKDNCLENNWSNSVDNIHPATQEQRDALMVAMTNAGYVFDFEKKELRKIEKSEDKLFQYIIEERNKPYFYYNGKEASWNDMPYDVRKHDYPYHFVGVLDCFPFSRAQNKLTGSQKSIWSEEDEINYNYALAACIYYGESKGYDNTKTHQDALAWLKSLKQRL